MQQSTASSNASMHQVTQYVLQYVVQCSTALRLDVDAGPSGMPRGLCLRVWIAMHRHRGGLCMRVWIAMHASKLATFRVSVCLYAHSFVSACVCYAFALASRTHAPAGRSALHFIDREADSQNVLRCLYMYI